MSEEQIPKEIADQPTPFNFVMSLAKALESRIDYNFNSIIQISMLVEYLYMQLEKKDLGIVLDEEFEKFQKERLEEIRSEFEKVTTQIKDVAEQDIDLEDK
jgi:hypothetical protein